MAAGAFSAATRAVIAERAWFKCERCRAARIEHIHHRRPRGAGGSRLASTSSAANGLALCASCHNWIESNRTEAERLGYLIRQGWNPTQVAVLLDGHLVLLDNDGGITPLPEEKS